MQINSINQAQSFKGVFVNAGEDWEKIEADSFHPFQPLSFHDIADNAKNQVVFELTSDSLKMKNKTNDKFFMQGSLEKMPVFLTNEDAVKFNSLKYIEEKKNFISDVLKSKFRFDRIQDTVINVIKRSLKK